MLNRYFRNVERNLNKSVTIMINKIVTITTFREIFRRLRPVSYRDIYNPTLQIGNEYIPARKFLLAYDGVLEPLCSGDEKDDAPLVSPIYVANIDRLRHLDPRKIIIIDFVAMLRFYSIGGGDIYVYNRPGDVISDAEDMRTFLRKIENAPASSEYQVHIDSDNSDHFPVNNRDMFSDILRTYGQYYSSLGDNMKLYLNNVPVVERRKYLRDKITAHTRLPTVLSDIVADYSEEHKESSYADS